MQHLICLWKSGLVPAMALSLVGCQSLSRFQPQCVALNQGTAIPHSYSFIPRQSPLVKSDLEKPNVVNGRSRVVPVPIPTDETIAANPKSESPPASSGYRSEAAARPPVQPALIEPQVARQKSQEEQPQDLEPLPAIELPRRPAVSTPVGPALTSPVPAEKKLETSIQLTVDSPAEAQINGEVLYKIRLSNSGNRTAQDVVLQCDFDAGLLFPGRDERGIIQRIGELPAGESREIELNLLARTEGESNCLFTARSSSVDAITPVSRKLQIVPQKLFLELTGPGQAHRGETLTFQVRVRNAGDSTLKNVTAALTTNQDLKPEFAEGNPQSRPDGFLWQISELEPASSREFKVRIKCLTEIDAAELKVVGTANGTPGDTLRATIDVQPPSALPAEVIPRLVPADVELGEPAPSL